MSDKILTALRQLEVDNANHWTAAGEPRIETVRIVASDPSISRDDINTAAPGFNRETAKDYGKQGDGAQGNGAGADGTAVGAAAQLGAEGQAERDAATPPTAPSDESLRGTDNDGLRAQMSEPGPNNLNAEGGPSDGPSVPDEVQAAAAAGAAIPPAPPEITQGTTERGFNALATPESDAFDAAISTAHAPGTPPELGGGAPREPSALTVDEPSDQSAIVGEGEAQLAPVEHGRAGDPDAVKALEAELEEAEARSAKLREISDEVAAELHNSVTNEARLRNAIEAASPRDGTMPAIQAYFAAQDVATDNVAELRKAVQASGLDLEKITKVLGPAPIDKAAAAPAVA